MSAAVVALILTRDRHRGGYWGAVSATSAARYSFRPCGHRHDSPEGAAICAHRLARELWPDDECIHLLSRSGELVEALS